MTSAALRPLVAIVPVRALEGAKSRLGEVLDAEERRDLVIELLERTIRAALEASIVDRVIVVSEDPDALAIAARAGARTLRDDGGGLNGSLALARAAARSDGAGGVLVLPGDLPSIAPGAIAAIASAAAQPPVVVLVTDRHHRGTNALLLSPPDVIPFAFGGDSRAAHAALAAGAGATYVELEGPLSLDLDTPDDLLLFDELGWPADRIRSGHRG